MKCMMASFDVEIMLRFGDDWIERYSTVSKSLVLAKVFAMVLI